MYMAKIEVHAGDFLKGNSSAHFSSFSLRTTKHSFAGESIPFSELETVEVANEEAVKRVGGTVGWGIVGGLALGPVGLLAGLLLGGKRKRSLS
jgi:hypothetical protein